MITIWNVFFTNPQIIAYFLTEISSAKWWYDEIWNQCYVLNFSPYKIITLFKKTLARHTILFLGPSQLVPIFSVISLHTLHCHFSAHYFLLLSSFSKQKYVAILSRNLETDFKLYINKVLYSFTLLHFPLSVFKLLFHNHKSRKPQTSNPYA